MFRILIHQTKNCIKQQNRQYAQNHRYRPNAGVRRQARAATNEIESGAVEWDDDLSQYEGDFNNSKYTYEKYQQESKAEKEKLIQLIVRNKYFKEKRLSFLTWAEMEQIRLLNAKDADEWNEQKLAESFPADVLTIRKILKSKWQPKDAKRIVKYDEKVELNWKSLANGELNDLDHRFIEHLQKFSARNSSRKVDYASFLKKEMPKPKHSEFSGIITGCVKYEEQPKLIAPEDAPKLPEHETKETFMLGDIGSQKLYTFKPKKAYRDDGTSVETETIFDNPNGTGIKTTNHPNNLNQQSSSSNPFAINKYEKNEVQLDGIDLKQLSMPSIRYHIEIPANLFQEGATYRLSDCYYDDDGEFLYRVPGMNG